MAARKGYSSYEKKDKASDRKAGIKEGGKRDMKVDAAKMRGRKRGK
jgi:hypothetical protein